MSQSQTENLPGVVEGARLLTQMNVALVNKSAEADQDEVTSRSHLRKILGGT